MSTSRESQDELQEIILEVENLTDYFSLLAPELILKIASFLPKLSDINIFAYTNHYILNSMKKFPMYFDSSDGNIKFMIYEDYIKLNSNWLLKKKIKDENSDSKMNFDYEMAMGPHSQACVYIFISSLVTFATMLGLMVTGTSRQEDDCSHDWETVVGSHAFRFCFTSPFVIRKLGTTGKKHFASPTYDAR